MSSKVFGEVLDTLGQQRHLIVRTSRIIVVKAVFSRINCRFTHCFRTLQASGKPACPFCGGRKKNRIFRECNTYTQDFRHNSCSLIPKWRHPGGKALPLEQLPASAQQGVMETYKP